MCFLPGFSLGKPSCTKGWSCGQQQFGNCIGEIPRLGLCAVWGVGLGVLAKSRQQATEAVLTSILTQCEAAAGFLPSPPSSMYGMLQKATQAGLCVVDGRTDALREVSPHHSPLPKYNPSGSSAPPPVTALSSRDLKDGESSFHH